MSMIMRSRSVCLEHRLHTATSSECSAARRNRISWSIVHHDGGRIADIEARKISGRRHEVSSIDQPDVSAGMLLVDMMTGQPFHRPALISSRNGIMPTAAIVDSAMQLAAPGVMIQTGVRTLPFVAADSAFDKTFRSPIGPVRSVPGEVGVWVEPA